MRKLLSLALLALSLTVSAQSLRVNRGQIHEVFEATTEEMTFGLLEGSTDQYTLTIGDVTYLTSDIESIEVLSETVDPSSVAVVYNTDGTADVTISGDLVPYMTTTVNGQNVSISADSLYDSVIQYTLSGTATAGTFSMDGEYATTVVLNGVSITSADTAAIDIRNGKHCTFVVNGENNFVDGASGGQKAAFFCNGHATFTGDGTINVTGNARHGYRSDEYTEFGGEFTGAFNVLSAASDGINVEQYLRVANGTITITNQTGDGIDVGINNDSTKLYNGQIFVSGGTINASATNPDTKAVKADSCITITGGTFNLNVSGDGTKGISAGTDFKTNGGTFNIAVSGGSYTYTDETGTEDTARCQGIRAKADFYLAGDETNHPTFNITNTSTDEKAYGVRIKGWFYYTAAALKASGFNTKDAKWTSGQAKKMDSIEF